MSCRSPLTVPATMTPSGLSPGRREQRPQGLHRRLHRPSGEHQFGNEKLLVPEENADLVHRGDHGFTDQRQRVGAVGQLLLDDRLRQRRLAAHDRVE